MEKKIFLFLFFVFAIGSCFAADDFGDINTGDNIDQSLGGEDASGVQATGDDVGQGSDPVYAIEGDKINDMGDGKFYTMEFYVALGLGVLVLCVVGIFIWFWIRGSKNKWD